MAMPSEMPCAGILRTIDDKKYSALGGGIGLINGKSANSGLSCGKIVMYSTLWSHLQILIKVS